MLCGAFPIIGLTRIIFTENWQTG